MAPNSEVDQLALGLTPEETKTAVWWVEGGTRFRGYKAIGRALRALGGRWSLAGFLIGVPPVSWFSSIAYRWVATNRHRLG